MAEGVARKDGAERGDGQAVVARDGLGDESWLRRRGRAMGKAWVKLPIIVVVSQQLREPNLNCTGSCETIGAKLRSLLD